MAGAAKRKRPVESSKTTTIGDIAAPPPTKRRSSARNIATAAVVNPDVSKDVFDAPDATRASPDSDVNEDIVPGPVKTENGIASESPLSDVPVAVQLPTKKAKAKAKKATVKSEDGTEESKVQPRAAVGNKSTTTKRPTKEEGVEEADPEAEGDEEADEEEVKEALSRRPPVNSDYLPLPWRGRLGYACLNTYLRNSNPPVFSSRTCRIQSILEHRHPLQDPSQPEHPTKNKPDRSKPADVQLGHRYVEKLGIANVKDISKMLRWNHRYNIKFLRLSSEMFPFASHPEYGYKLTPFASEALAAAGKVITELGHRVTTHPGQFTQLGSPRKQVIENSIRDLDYHDEMLSLLKLPEQLNKDAVMILHMGGMFEGKQETLQRFREHYAGLSESVKNRLVLENDDVIWSVHDLLPVCEEMNIPLVLDFHHHNIVFDANQIREGTKDIMELFPRIKATWDRKGIKQKMHYSEPTPAAITGRQRRKHNPRVYTLPPCSPDMDLMIEAKDKEQAVFELMKIYRLPGFDSFSDVLPYARNDDNKVALAAMNRKKKPANETELELVSEDDIGMGGPDGRVYWPPGMEEWLRPKKREVKKKEPVEQTPDQKKKKAAELYAAREAEKNVKAEAVSDNGESDLDATPATKKAKAAMRAKVKAAAEKTAIKAAAEEIKDATAKANKAAPQKKKGRAKKQPQAVPTPSSSDELDESLDLDDEEEEHAAAPVPKPNRKRMGNRRAAKGAVSYSEDESMAED